MTISNDKVVANQNQRQLLEYQRRFCVVAKGQISCSEGMCLGRCQVPKLAQPMADLLSCFWAMSKETFNKEIKPKQTKAN